MKSVVKGLVVLAAVVGICAWAVEFVINNVAAGIIALVSSLSLLDVAIIVALITGCVSIVATIFGSIVNSYLTNKHRREEFLRDRREAPYRKLVEINFKILEKQNKNETYSGEEALADYMEFGQELVLWGSAKAIRLWNEWRLASVNGKPSGEDLLFAMEKVLIQLRIDMGQKKGLKEGDILRMFINDIDVALERRKTRKMINDSNGR